MDASPMAKGYYKLPDNAKWVDTLKCMVSFLILYCATHSIGLDERQTFNASYAHPVPHSKSIAFRWLMRHIIET